MCPCNPHAFQDAEHFPSSPSPSVTFCPEAATVLIFFHLSLASSRTRYKWNHTIYTFSNPASFIQFHTCCGVSGVLFHCMDRSLFICSDDRPLGCFQFEDITIKACINRFNHFYICLQPVLFLK